MNCSSCSINSLDKHQTEHISYIIHQCVECHSPLSLRCASVLNKKYKYLFESNGLPTFVLMKMLSIYFDSMVIDVNNECTTITLSIDMNKELPF